MWCTRIEKMAKACSVSYQCTFRKCAQIFAAAIFLLTIAYLKIETSSVISSKYHKLKNNRLTNAIYEPTTANLTDFAPGQLKFPQCQSLLTEKPNKAVLNWAKIWKPRKSFEEQYSFQKFVTEGDCRRLGKLFSFPTESGSDEEKNFPLAP